MKIAIIGATGNLGRQLVEQGLERGFSITAIAPKCDMPIPTSWGDKVNYIDASADDKELLIDSFRGNDVVLSVFPADIKHPERYSDQTRNVFLAVHQSGVGRIVGLIGSAGALVAQGGHLVDSDYFQETTRHFYKNILTSYDVYRQEKNIEWAACVPAARMEGGMPRLGKYRVRTDGYLVVTDENSRNYFDVSQISYADCAMAMLDEAENRKFSGKFFTVGY